MDGYHPLPLFSGCKRDPVAETSVHPMPSHAYLLSPIPPSPFPTLAGKADRLEGGIFVLWGHQVLALYALLPTLPLPLSQSIVKKSYGSGSGRLD